MQFIVEGYPAYAYTGGRPYAPGPNAVVFVHGAAFDHSVWQWQSRYLAHHGHAVLALDLPGHGRSPGALRDRIEAFSDWVAAFIAAAGLERAAVVGHSMGSLVALDTALRHPARVARVALVGAAVPMAVGDPFLAAARDDSPAALDMEVTWGLARHATLATSPIPGTVLHGASRSLNARAQAGALHADLTACRAYQPSMDAIRALKLPALVVGGTRDVMTPIKFGRALACEIKGARFATLESGHSMMSEAPRELLALLKEFLREG
jgi:pimeloyl-ACP methyl ester carboxylesterase